MKPPMLRWLPVALVALVVSTATPAQDIRGNCNVVVAKLEGDNNKINVDCAGIPRRALRALRARLTKVYAELNAIESKDAQQDDRLAALENKVYGQSELKRRADAWATEYLRLQRELDAARPRGSKTRRLLKKARSHLEDGELQDADRYLQKIKTLEQGD